VYRAANKYRNRPSNSKLVYEDEDVGYALSLQCVTLVRCEVTFLTSKTEEYMSTCIIGWLALHRL